MRLLDSIHRADITAFHWFTTHKYRNTIVHQSRWVSMSADGLLYVLVGLLVTTTKQWDMASLMALAFLLERTLYLVFKSLFKRNRPPQAIPGFKSVVEPSDRFSFPSGHTSAAFLFASISSYFYPPLSLFLLPWAAAVGVARVVLGVHFPTDVMAGAGMGLFVFLLSTHILF